MRGETFGCLQDTRARWYKTLEVGRKSSGEACQVSYPRRHCGMEELWELRHTRCLFQTFTASSPGLSLGSPRSSVASGAGLEPGAPRRRHRRRAYEMDI